MFMFTVSELQNAIRLAATACQMQHKQQAGYVHELPALEVDLDFSVEAGEGDLFLNNGGEVFCLEISGDLWSAENIEKVAEAGLAVFADSLLF